MLGIHAELFCVLNFFPFLTRPTRAMYLVMHLAAIGGSDRHFGRNLNAREHF